MYNLVVKSYKDSNKLSTESILFHASGSARTFAQYKSKDRLQWKKNSNGFTAKNKSGDSFNVINVIEVSTKGKCLNAEVILLSIIVLVIIVLIILP